MLQLEVRFQQLDLDEKGIRPEEQFDEKETHFLPPIKQRKKTLKDLE